MCACVCFRFIDAKSYFEAVAEALEKAKEEIYITDWWSVSPVSFLRSFTVASGVRLWPHYELCCELHCGLAVGKL